MFGVTRGTKGRCGVCLKGFQSRRAQFLKVSIPLWSILRLDTTWLLFQRERGSLWQSTFGEQGQRMAGMGRGGRQRSRGCTWSGNKMGGALRLLICAQRERGSTLQRQEELSAGVWCKNWESRPGPEAEIARLLAAGGKQRGNGKSLAQKKGREVFASG